LAAQTEEAVALNKSLQQEEKCANTAKTEATTWQDEVVALDKSLQHEEKCANTAKTEATTWQEEAGHISDKKLTELEEQASVAQATMLGDHGQELARIASLHAAALSARDAAATDAQEAAQREIGMLKHQGAQELHQAQEYAARMQAEGEAALAEAQQTSAEAVRRKYLEFAKTSALHLAELDRAEHKIANLKQQHLEELEVVRREAQKAIEDMKQQCAAERGSRNDFCNSLEQAQQELAEARKTIQDMERRHAVEKEAWQGGYDELEQDLIAARERQSKGVNADALGLSVLSRGEADELRSKVAVCAEEILRREALIQGMEKERTEAEAIWQQKLAQVQENLREAQEEVKLHKQERDAAVCSQVENQRALETSWTKADELMHQESECAKALSERTAEYHAVRQELQRRFDDAKGHEAAGWDLAETVKADSERAMAMCRAELAAERRRSEEIEACSNEVGRVAPCRFPSRERPCATQTPTTPIATWRTPTLLEMQARPPFKGWEGNRAMLHGTVARSSSPPLTQESRMQPSCNRETMQQRLASLEWERKHHSEEVRRHTENLRRQVRICNESFGGNTQRT